MVLADTLLVPAVLFGLMFTIFIGVVAVVIALIAGIHGFSKSRDKKNSGKLVEGSRRSE